MADPILEAEPAKLADALQQTDRCLRRLVKILKEDGDHEQALKLARRQLRANLEMRGDPAGRPA